MTSEIDKRIATEVMEWPINLMVGRDDGPGIFITAAGGIIQGPDGGRFEPSTNIAHAWEVVEKMRTDGYESYVWRMPEHFDPGLAHARFAKRGFSRGGGGAETAPLAICKAALAAVEDK